MRVLIESQKLRFRFWLVACLLFLHFSGNAATTQANMTVRVPRNVRVVATNGTVSYVALETYVARVLHQEWYSTWTNYPGGLNSLKSGAVAIRAYVIARVNSAATNSMSDICATTSCQVYRTTSSHHTVIAADDTAGVVLTTNGLTILSTEYSAENNSLGFACGDGYTAPNGSCIYDPVCTGETRFGHGRGYCQWGSAKWATGLKMAGNGSNYPANADGGALNGQPKQSWDWILNHYYPNLLILKGTPLVDGDDVRTSDDIQVRTNAGMNAAFIMTKPAGSVGVIMTNASNGILVTNDTFGFTWYQIRWSDGTIGWSPENWLQRTFIPSAPFNLTATTISTTQINLTWSDTNATEKAFELQRSPITNGNWAQIKTFPADRASYADTNVLAGTTYYYRIRAYNVYNNSSFSNTTNATTPGIPPTLPAISNKTVVEGALLTFTNAATAPDFEQSLTDFERFSAGSGVMFRPPNISGSTSVFIDSSTSSNLAEVTASFPAGTNQHAQVLNVNWSFTNASNPWLRLTTASNASVSLPNPAIDFTRKLRFDIHTDKALKVALGCRETTIPAGTEIGSNGGNSGAIEWVGATGVLGSGPAPSRTVPATTWTTLTFNLPTEPVVSFSAGNGVLSTASGLGVLEHLAFVPAAGNGAYNVFLDNFIIATAKTLTYSLSNAPTGASINASTGVFTWTPTEAQGPGSYTITVRVTDNATPPLSDSKTFTVMVTETNAAPVLASIANYTIHAGNMLMITNTATDSDLPANVLTFSLTNAPSGASVDSASGIFNWRPLDAQANTTNAITAKVTDNSTPPLSNSKNFSVIVQPRPTLQSISANGGNFSFTWSAIVGRKYRVQYKDDLGAANWSDLTDITANSSTASFSETAGLTQRYYRVIDLD
ncbi:MAG: Stage sporulation protein [Verrucomicrobiales bacterium]|nr:Stage sporulation protein [Verrucomicrobiales bacterium]